MPLYIHTRHGLGRIPGFKGYFAMLKSLQSYEQSEVAQKRLEMINFYQKYGEEATKEAFGADRKVINRWRQKLKRGQGKLQSLVPASTAPKHKRQSQVDSRIIDWIKRERELHPLVGKAKLKPDLDIYCTERGIKTISESMIGLLIKKHHFFYQKQIGKIYHDPNSKIALNQVRKTKRLRIKHSPRPADYGHILSDTVTRIIDGQRRYFISAIDAKGKFALTLEYKNATTKNMLDFYSRFQQVCPHPIRIWQSDNGSENLGIFDQQLKRDHIPHYFIYPRCPKIDTFIERYNRTFQEELIDFNEPEFLDLTQGNSLLVDWNIYYNTKRRHHSLGLLSPLDYLIKNEAMSHMSLTYTSN